jgi:hypothetical protein
MNLAIERTELTCLPSAHLSVFEPTYSAKAACTRIRAQLAAKPIQSRCPEPPWERLASIRKRSGISRSYQSVPGTITVTDEDDLGLGRAPQ